MLPRIREHFVEGESDCTIVSENKNAIQAARRQLIADRDILIRFIAYNPAWEASLVPVRSENASPIIALMEDVTEICNVGPMAAVAGALADRMQEVMVHQHRAQIAVIEDGGEIAVKSSEDIIVALYVMTTALKANLGFKFEAGNPPLGIGTSSGQFGHAFSFGEADVATIFAKNAALADAAATRICNNVKGNDYEKAVMGALEIIDDLPGIEGAFIVRGKFVGQKGKIPPIIRIQDGEPVIWEEKLKKV